MCKAFLIAILKGHSIHHSNDNTEVQLIFDSERDRYQVLHLGWEELRRVYGCIIHVDIKDDKILIQRDGTEIGVANELVAAEVPKQDIVLGFHAPYKRKFTEFAVE
ncbi:fatty-acid oxidation protein subunit alpha [Nostoc minutum NIES-26]|uniref:Fatty-acid oxidation protein subunit alpha n=1 Tax=Nostoc minutum NIES-26 TaxID=1844469 RepID=A0A367R364_9NOSO|nr:fatty-acid oxidation protein subunit alpha [Nostoc minutum NIES-26]